MANYNWDLTEIYLDDESYNKDFELFKSRIEEFKSFEGKLSDEESLIKLLTLERDTDILLTRLYTYAQSVADLDRRSVEANSREAILTSTLNDFVSAISFIEPEILSLGKEKMDEFISKHKEFNDFDFTFRKLFDGQSHVLTKDKELLISRFGPLSGVASDLYSTLSVSDYKPKTIKLGEKEVTVTVSNWRNLIMEAKDASEREAIFNALYEYFDERKNTYAEMYHLGLEAQQAVVKARGYKSILDYHLEHNQIPTSVYRSLVEVASSNTDAIKKYYELRRKALGLTKHRSYDRFLEIANSETKVTYEEAKDLFYKSIERFPKEFQDKAHFVSSEGRVDVFPKEGKRSGAYSNGGEGIKPYILLNFVGTLDDAFTLAHECGHSIHTMYSIENQPELKQNYTIFVAEIASTFNEHNLLDYLLKQPGLSKNDKIALLQKSIDDILATFYRQTLFAQFELEISEAFEKGSPINYEVLNNKMAELYSTYYGIDINEEKYKPLVWAYIPHLFYTPFYVYQYATSFAASLELYSRVNRGEEGAFDKYISLLKAGGSDYPINEVKEAGVDLTTKEPFYAVTNRLQELVDELEKLLA